MAALPKAEFFKNFTVACAALYSREGVGAREPLTGALAEVVLEHDQPNDFGPDIGHH